FSSRRRHTRFSRDWSSDVCSSDLVTLDEDSLPGDVGLTNDRPSLTIQLRPGRTTAPALFPLGIGGEGTRNVASTYERAVRLTIQIGRASGRERVGDLVRAA